MKKKLRNVFITGLILLGLLSQGVSAFADGTLKIGVSEMKAESDKLYIQVNDNLASLGVTGEYTVTLDGTEYPVLSANTIGEEAVSVSYMLLVDVSGSMNADSLNELKATMNTIVAGMGENDNACVLLLGNNLVAGDFSSDKNALTEQINAIESTHEDTNLYYGITEALRLLSTSTDAKEKKVLMVFSDGKDEQTNGITREEVNTAIEDSNLTVFTIAPSYVANDEDKAEASKEMGSFARLSAGGEHFLLGDNGFTAEVAGGTILASITAGRVLTVDISEYKTETADCYVEVTVNAEGVGAVSDGCVVSSASITSAITKAEVDETDDKSTEESKDKNETKKEESKLVIFIISGVAAAIIIILIVLLICINKNKKKANRALADAEIRHANDEAGMRRQLEGAENLVQNLASELEEEKAKQHKESSDTPVMLERVVITFTLFSRTEECQKKFELKKNESLLIGRNAQKATFVIENDSKISGLHCRIDMTEKGDLLLTDCESRNGTLVNRVPISEEWYLADGDIIGLGASEWRFNI